MIVMDTTVADPIVVTMAKKPVSIRYRFNATNFDHMDSENDWFASVYFDDHGSSNSTHHYIEKIEDCRRCLEGMVAFAPGDFTLTRDGSVSTIAFKINSTNFFAQDDGTVALWVMCDTTFGFMSSGVTVEADVKYDGAAHYYTTTTNTLDVAPIATVLEKIGTATVFDVVLVHPTEDLSAYGTALYNQMIADVTQKAEDIHHGDVLSVDPTHHDDLEFQGGVVCGMASEFVELTSGYACRAVLKVTFAGDNDLLVELAQGYNTAVIAAMTSLPADTYAEKVAFAVKDVAGSCSDGIKDSTEADVDCGFDACTKTCEVGASCMSALDCSTGKCVDSKCSNSASAVSVMAVMAMIGAVVALIM
jgi:hypothetical protein